MMMAETGGWGVSPFPFYESLKNRAYVVMGPFNTTTLVDPFDTSPEHGKMQCTVVYIAFQCVENVIRLEWLGLGPTVEGYKKMYWLVPRYILESENPDYVLSILKLA